MLLFLSSFPVNRELKKRSGNTSPISYISVALNLAQSCELFIYFLGGHRCFRKFFSPCLTGLYFLCEGERRGDAGQKTASTGTAAAKTLQTLLYILTLP